MRKTRYLRIRRILGIIEAVLRVVLALLAIIRDWF